MGASDFHLSGAYNFSLCSGETNSRTPLPGEWRRPNRELSSIASLFITVVKTDFIVSSLWRVLLW